MNRQLIKTLLTTVACCVPALSVAATLTAPTPTSLKIPAGAMGAGRAVAVSESYIAVGAPDSKTANVNDAGEVLIYRASDNVLIRRISSPTPTFGGAFGLSVALHGGIVYVGAPGESASGAASSGFVYAFNASTGAKLWATSGAAGQRIGGALAAGGNHLVVGAPAGNLAGRPALSGSALVLNRITGAKGGALELFNPMANDRFGAAVAISGGLVAIGAPGRDSDGFTDNGLVLLLDYVYNNGSVVATLKSPTLKSSTDFGAAVAITRETVLVGSPGYDGFYTNIGRVDAFNTSGTFLREFENPHFDDTTRRQQGRALAASGWLATCGMRMLSSTDGMTVLQDIRGSFSYTELAPHSGEQAENMGVAVAMNDQLIVIGDDQQPVSATPSTSGAVWVLRQPRQPMQSTVLFAKTGNPAPGLFNVQYSSISHAVISESMSGKVMFRATLKGKGVTTANDTAVFNNWAGSLQELLLREGSSQLGSVSTFGKPYFTSGNSVSPILPATIAGKNHILRDTGAALETDIHTGNPVISVITATTTGTDDASTLFLYNKKIGTASTTAANDTRIASYKANDVVHSDIIIESGTSPDMTRNYGQILPRLAAAKDNFVFACNLSGSTTGNTALVLKKGMAPEVIIAQKGQTVAGLGAPLSSFIGEGVNRDGSVVYRAILAGGTECLLLKIHNGGTAKVALKGDLAPGAGAGVRFASFSRFFIGPDNTVIFTARLSGSGVTTSNDVGVWVKTNSATHLLMREGNPAPDCGSALIASISNVEMSPIYGTYAILATLTGSTSQNQAAFFGDATEGAPALLMPQLNLRKGAWIDRPAGQRITGISMGTHHLDASGSGSTGRARIITNSGALITVKYSDGVSELRTLRP